jgi:alpha/beta superfamily hydrolase
MRELAVQIPVEKGKVVLEGLWLDGKIGRSVVLCHPHPLYGGNMQNNVVIAAQQAFASQGWGTLRFNFRGVGKSGGKAAQGTKDAEDLLEVAEYLRTNHPGKVDFAAYSYGAWATMEALRLGLSPDLLALISPPLDFMSFSGLELPDRDTLITLGNQDEFCAVESLKKWLATQHNASSATLEILAYGDHFYWGQERELSEKITTFLTGLSHGD